MERQIVTLVREVSYTNHDGSFAGRKTEAIDVVVEWPDKRIEATVNGYLVEGDWRVTSRLDPKVDPNA